METFYIILIALLFCLVGYLMGSFLSGDFFIKIFKRKNIRNYGSGNVGATNVRRTFGRKFGFIVALLDAVKGYLAVMICFFI
jgi:glycerol-3-phosphate acyltransferase PlsY